MNKSKIEDYLITNFNVLNHFLREENTNELLKFAEGLWDVKLWNRRLFLFGVGGSAANCSHATNDFRKILNIQTYCATDNVAELTARINDQSWEDSMLEWLKVEKPSDYDAIMVFSVGGGNDKVSQNLVKVMNFAKEKKMKIFSIVGRDGGKAKELSDYCIHIPEELMTPQEITPVVEGFQGVFWHMMVKLLKEKENENIS